MKPTFPCKTTSNRRPRHRSGAAKVLTPNLLQLKIEVVNPNDTWVTDITHSHTSSLAIPDSSDRSLLTQGGWLIYSQIKKELVLTALLMAVWHRKPGFYYRAF